MKNLNLFQFACVAATLFAWAGPAAAQSDVGFDPSAIEECLENDGGNDCIGLGAATCQPAEDGGSNVDYGLCFGAELDWWDAQLIAIYDELITLYEDNDAVQTLNGSLAAPVVPTLQDAQRAWADWRDAACVFEATTWGVGSGAGIAETECLMTLTGEQVLRLDAHLAELEG